MDVLIIGAQSYWDLSNSRYDRHIDANSDANS